MELTYLGHSGFVLSGTKGRVVVDPFLTDNPTAAAKADDLEVGFVLLTHGHGDHIGDAVEIAKANGATVIAPFELANYCGEQGVDVHPMHIGGAHEFPFGRVKLTIAHHGSAAPDGTYTGNPCGFVVTMDKKTIYHAGDTGVFLDMQLIGELDPLDVALLPIGDNFTMGIDDAVKATELLKPGLVIPMHYKTFDVIEVDPQEFADKVAAKGFAAKVLDFGGSTEI